MVGSVLALLTRTRSGDEVDAGATGHEHGVVVVAQTNIGVGVAVSMASMDGSLLSGARGRGSAWPRRGPCATSRGASSGSRPTLLLLGVLVVGDVLRGARLRLDKPGTWHRGDEVGWWCGHGSGAAWLGARRRGAEGEANTAAALLGSRGEKGGGGAMGNGAGARATPPL